MTDWPKIERVTLDEVVEKADELLVEYGLKPTVSAWVEGENARRAQAKIEFEAADVEVAGVTLQVGRVYNLTIRKQYGSARRALNCLFRGQRLSRGYDGRHHSLSFTQYGKSPSGYPSGHSLSVKEVVAVEPVETPDWLAARAKESARWDRELASMVGGDDDED